jgi:predicted SpoU family rRNA methylase
MTTKGSVASITKIIDDFAGQMTLGMKKNVRKHFREYMLGIMTPPEIRRKSISNVASLISEYDQSTLNRSYHAVVPEILEKNYINYLKAVSGNHRIQFIGDDTLL